MLSSQDVILEPRVNTSTQMVASRMKTHLQGEREDRGRGEEALGQAGTLAWGPGREKLPSFKANPQMGRASGTMSKFWKLIMVMVARHCHQVVHVKLVYFMLIYYHNTSDGRHKHSWELLNL